MVNIGQPTTNPNTCRLKKTSKFRCFRRQAGVMTYVSFVEILFKAAESFEENQKFGNVW